MLSRDLQLTLLNEYAKIYPSYGRPNPQIDGFTDQQVQANLFYLSEHGLFHAKWDHMLNGSAVSGNIRLSAKGMDFLQDDGGLGAILGVVTVKLHDDTIRALLIDKVEKSDAAPSTKAHLIAAIKSLPAEGLKSLAQKAMDAGIEHLPSAIQPLQEWLGL